MFRIAWKVCMIGDAAFMSKSSIWYTPVATYMKITVPQKEDIEYPERRKMAAFDKTPNFNNEKIVRRTKNLIDIRGPELIHNRLLYGKFGLQVEYGCFLNWGHLSMIRNIIIQLQNQDMFSVWRVEQPWRPMTKKGEGLRMGAGKGPVKKFTYPVKAGRIIFEIGGDCSYSSVKRMMRQVTSRMPAKSRIVTNKMLEKEAAKEKRLAKLNVNPFDFVECIKNDTLGVRVITSPYDTVWRGKYR